MEQHPGLWSRWPWVRIDPSLPLPSCKDAVTYPPWPTAVWQATLKLRPETACGWGQAGKGASAPLVSGSSEVGLSHLKLPGSQWGPVLALATRLPGAGSPKGRGWEAAPLPFLPCPWELQSCTPTTLRWSRQARGPLKVKGRDLRPRPQLQES